MSEDFELVNITPEGERAARAGIADPAQALVMKVATMVEDVTLDHLLELCAGLVERFGSPKRALKAIKRGRVALEKKPWVSTVSREQLAAELGLPVEEVSCSIQALIEHGWVQETPAGFLLTFPEGHRE